MKDIYSSPPINNTLKGLVANATNNKVITFLFVIFHMALYAPPHTTYQLCNQYFFILVMYIILQKIIFTFPRLHATVHDTAQQKAFRCNQFVEPNMKLLVRRGLALTAQSPK